LHNQQRSIPEACLLEACPAVSVLNISTRTRVT
jgi:hypothetical protein